MIVTNTAPQPTQREELRRIIVLAAHRIAHACGGMHDAPQGLSLYDWRTLPYRYAVVLDEDEVPGARGTLHVVDRYGIEHSLDWRAGWDAERRAVLCIGPASLNANDEAWT